MVAAADSPQSLLLAGYVSLQKHGFALPCFATKPRPNTWYTAQTRIEGDRLSVISGFEEYAAADVSPLPDEQIRQMAVGDSWCDVFIWDGKAYLGNPTELWDALNPAIAAIDARAPLSLFELSADIGSQERRTSADSVRRFLAHRYGTDVVDSWRLSVTRSAVQLRLRRFLPAARQPGAALVDVELTLEADGLRVLLPAHLADPLFTDPRCVDWNDELAEFTADIGLVLRKIAKIGAVPPEAEASRPDELAPPPEHRILILTAGRRAREIGRLVAAPAWSPVWSQEGHPLHLPRLATVDVRDPREAWRAADFDLVIILASDAPDEPPIAVDRILSQIEFGARPVLLAPVADKHSATPSHVGRGGYPRVVRGIVDTSLARSPIWPDGSGRSIDRGIADLLVGVGTLLAGQSPMCRALADWPGKQPPVLQYMTWAGSGPGDEGLLSEFCGLPSGETYWQAEFAIASSKRGYKAKRGICRLSTGGPDFPLLVNAVVRNTAGSMAPDERFVASAGRPCQELQDRRAGCRPDAIQFPAHQQSDDHCGNPPPRAVRSGA